MGNHWFVSSCIIRKQLEIDRYDLNVVTWEGMIMRKSVKVIIKHEYIYI